MTDTSKYPHQSEAWILFIIFVLLFLSGAYYYTRGVACYHNIVISPHWGSTVNTLLCGNDINMGILIFVVSIIMIPISFVWVCLTQKEMVKCPKCGYEFEGGS